MAINALEMAGIAGGQSLLNQGLGMLNQERQAKINREQAKYQQGLDKEMAKYTYNLTNTSALMKQLKSNDLNPTLALGSGGTGGQTVSTGNSGTQGVGMVDTKITAAEAMQMSLLEAQKNNIEADTKLKEADANKTSGVDTDEKKATIENIIANTKNEETKNKLMQVQTNLLKISEMESNMSREDRMYNIKMNMRKAAEEVRALSRSNEIGEETKEELITQIKLQTIGARLENELTKANINLSRAQADSLREHVRIGWFGAANKLREMSQKDRELKILEFNAKADAIYKGASTVLGRVANDIIYDVSSEVDNELK